MRRAIRIIIEAVGLYALYSFGYNEGVRSSWRAIQASQAVKAERREL